MGTADAQGRNPDREFSKNNLIRGRPVPSCAHTVTCYALKPVCVPLPPERRYVCVRCWT